MGAERVVGERIADEYELLSPIGEGGMGVVWRALQLRTSRIVALKFLHDASTASAIEKARFAREARAASAVQSPHVIQIFHVVDVEGEPVLVMELLPGESLATRLKQKGSLAVAEACDVLLQVVAALRAVHAANIVHRDLKPENIHIIPSHDSETIKLLDFGIARLRPSHGNDHAPVTATGEVIGTLDYMSPEQAFGEDDIDWRTDVWSLGVIAYQLLSGRSPTHGHNSGQTFKNITRGPIRPLASIASEIPPDVINLVGEMLTIDRMRRPGLDRIDSVLERYRTGAPPVTPRRKPELRVAIAAIALSGSAVGAWWFLDKSTRHVNERSKQAKVEPTAKASSSTSPCVVDVAVGGFHACARTRDGSLWCWGNNESGQLGTGNFQSTPLPVRVDELGTDVTQVVAGESHTCARKADGTAWCWGYNYSSQLGDGTKETRTAPVKVNALGTHAVQLAAGQLHTCARKDDGTLWCWGNNYHGGLGNGNCSPTPVPTQVATLGTSAVEIAAGGNHTCARRGGDGAIWCWGRADLGALGTGTVSTATGCDPPRCMDASCETKPVAASAFSNGTLQVTVGFYHTCARRGDGTIWCWGGSEDGEAGDGTSGPPRLSPAQVFGLNSEVVDIASGYFHNCARKGDGTLWCWGGNKTPLHRVDALGTDVVGVSARWNTCARKSDGTLWCWGNNNWGQLGNGTSGPPTSVPVRVNLSCR